MTGILLGLRDASGRSLLFGSTVVSGGTGPIDTTPTGGGSTTPSYATTFTVRAAASMTVGTQYAVTITPDGTWSPGKVVALGLSGLAGTFVNGVGSGSSPVVILFTPTAASNGFINASAQGMTSAGNVSVSVASAQSTTPSGPMSQSFTVPNWGTAPSAGLLKRGVWFSKGDVPAGSVPVSANGAIQFYGLRHYSDGSLQLARALIRDSDLAAGASHVYTLTTASGTMPSGSTKAIGNAGLVAALAGHDFKVNFTNVRDYANATYNGGTLVASLNAHAVTATRWELLTTGLVADVWQGWGLANDPHLKVNWYITRWKNADGTTRAFQIGAAPALDWWSVAGKSDLTYDAALMDGSTTILSYVGVQHGYHSQWLMCINDGTFNAGQVPFVGIAQPTLSYTFDKTYAIMCGVMAAPYRVNKIPQNIPAMNPYVPCNVVPNDGHRTYLDAGGGYPGRGAVPRFDSDAFMAQTPQANTISRLNALTGLSVPFHFRSNRTRIRSGEAADMANTNIVVLMAPKPASASDFTDQGLPQAVDAYCSTSGGGSTVGQDGFVVPNRASWYFWNVSHDSSHAVSYSYYQGLISGDEWFVDAQQDITLNLLHQQIYLFQAPILPWSTALNSAAPTDRYSGLLGLWGGQDGNIRYFGWAALIQGHGFGLLPDDHQYKPFARALMAHQGDFLAANLDYLPDDFKAAGLFSANTTSLDSVWMGAFGPIGSYFHYALNGDVRWKRVADMMVNWTMAQAEARRWYAWDGFRNLLKRSIEPWNAVTNPILAPADMPFLRVTFELDATATFTQGTADAFMTANWNDIYVNPPPLRNGDWVVFTKQEESGYQNAVTIPGVAEGTVGYIINLTDGDNFLGENHVGTGTPLKFQVSATPGGPPMSFGGQVVSRVNMPTHVSSVSDPAYAVSSCPKTIYDFPYFYSPNNYIYIQYTAFNMARHAGHPRATDALTAAAKAFIAPNTAHSDNDERNYLSVFDTEAIV